MNAPSSLSRKTTRRHGLALIATAALALLAAAPAMAGHDKPVHRGGGYGEVCDVVNHQYERGFERGKIDGWRQGAQDARFRNGFCDIPHMKLRRYSRDFRDGYLDSYKKSYRDGFHAAKKRRSHWRNGRHGSYGKYGRGRQYRRGGGYWSISIR